MAKLSHFDCFKICGKLPKGKNVQSLPPIDFTKEREMYRRSSHSLVHCSSQNPCIACRLKKQQGNLDYFFRNFQLKKILLFVRILGFDFCFSFVFSAVLKSHECLVQRL